MVADKKMPWVFVGAAELESANLMISALCQLSYTP
jgi:hypothetical protein